MKIYEVKNLSGGIENVINYLGNMVSIKKEESVLVEKTENYIGSEALEVTYVGELINSRDDYLIGKIYEKYLKRNTIKKEKSFEVKTIHTRIKKNKKTIKE